MSAPAYVGQAAQHTLTALKGWYREAALDAEVSINTTTVNLGGTTGDGLIVSGLCIHAVSTTANTDPYGGTFTGPGTMTAEIGCGPAHGLPMFLWPNANDPDVANPGVLPGNAYSSTTVEPDFVPVFPLYQLQNMVALVASGAYELETTEFDTTRTYAPGDALRAVTNNDNANGGKLTNQRKSTTPDTMTTTGATQYVANSSTVTNWDTIVGFVSRGEFVNSNKREALAFYTAFIPGTR